MVGISTQLQVIPQKKKTPKTQQICHYRHATKTSGHFLLYDTGVGVNSLNNFANLDSGSFAKVSVPLQFIPLCGVT